MIKSREHMSVRDIGCNIFHHIITYFNWYHQIMRISKPWGIAALDRISLLLISKNYNHCFHIFITHILKFDWKYNLHRWTNIYNIYIGMSKCLNKVLNTSLGVCACFENWHIGGFCSTTWMEHPYLPQQLCVAYQALTCLYSTDTCLGTCLYTSLWVAASLWGFYEMRGAFWWRGNYRVLNCKEVWQESIEDHCLEQNMMMMVIQNDRNVNGSLAMIMPLIVSKKLIFWWKQIFSFNFHRIILCN